MDYSNEINEYLLEEKKVLDTLDINEINEVINVLETTRLSGNQIFICGNGGSAATASHFVCDFNKGVNEKVEKKYNFECLSDNVPMMMAVANDISYDEVFREPLKCKMKSGDILIGISGSGNSKNVINAFEYAIERGNKTIAIVGYDGGRLLQMSNFHIHVNINNMQISEDVHMLIDHLMMYVICHTLKHNFL